MDLSARMANPIFVWPKTANKHLNPERPIYFYPLAADCRMPCDFFYFSTFGRLNVAGGKNNHL